MKTACLRCGSDFDCKPSAHPPRFCEPCESVLQSHATGKERAAAKRLRYETRQMANGRHLPRD